MKRNVWILSLIGVAALALAWQTGIAQNAAKAPTPAARVAVCDIASVFNRYQRATDLGGQFNDRRDRIKEEDKTKGEQMDQVEKMLKELKSDSKEYKEQSATLEKLSVERTVWRKMQEQAVIKDHRDLTEQMYQEIVAAIAQLAKDQGYDLVLYLDAAEINSETTQELLGKIAQRKVLYCDPSLDITETVLQRVNAAYAANKKK